MSDRPRDHDHKPGELRLWRDDEQWIAQDQATGLTARGHSRMAALDRLDDKVAEQQRSAERGPTAEELDVLDIDPNDAAPNGTSPD